MSDGAYDEAVAEAVCRRAAAGESLTAICAEDGMPGQAVVTAWLAAEPSFAQRYADALFEAVQAIADGPGEVSRAKLRIDTLKWRLGKLSPRKYGDKAAPEGEGTVTVEKIERILVRP
jgi:hypothetical protein